MKIIKYIKTTILLLLTFLLGAQTTYAKTELVLPQKQVIFSVEQTPKASTLEKEVQPNVGFLKEKFKFVAVEGVSAEKTFAFAERVGGKLANAGDGFLEEVISTIPASQRNAFHLNAGRLAPYGEAFDVSLVKLNPSEEYIRVFKKSVDNNGVIQSNKVSYWFMRKKDIIKPDGSLITPLEIKNKYALPELPTHYTNVNLPPGKQVYRGVAKEQIQQGWGNGGVIQIEINEPPQNSWFTGEISL